MTMRWERQGWLLAWAASMMWVGGSGMVAAQEPAPGTDARLTVTASIAAATQEADDAAFQEADDSEVEAGGDETQLRQQIQALNVLLREYEQKLRGMSLRRQVDRVTLQRTLAERAMEEAQLAQRVQELLLNGQAAGGRYWLGVQTIPLSDLNQEMRAELKLEEGASGVVIDAVVEESPAAAAGLQRMDVIVRANDQPVEDVGGLIEIVARVDGNKLTLEVVRSGEELEVQVTPVERPITFTIPQEGYRLENFSVMRGFAPGAAGVTQLSLKTVEIPDGMSLQVTRHGNEPAQIKVDFEGESYEVTSESLDTLPESIREQVRAALSGIDGSNEAGVFKLLFDGDLDARGLDGAGLEHARRAMAQMQSEIGRDLAPGNQFRRQPGQPGADREPQVRRIEGNRELSTELEQMRAEMAEIKEMLQKLLDERD